MNSCEDTDCPRVFLDGYCDRCGEPEPASLGNVAAGLAIPQVREEYGSASPIITRTSRSDMESARAARLGLGCAAPRPSNAPRWPLPKYTASHSPVDRVIANPVLPAGKAVCPQCATVVDPNGRFCETCSAEYAFKPVLVAGEMVGDQYQNAGCIAYGGMGWIYLARDVRLERWVVLKGLLNGADKDAAAAAALEKRHLSAVRHPGIVAIHDYVEHQGRAYIVMEYVDGISLKTFRAVNGPLSIHEALGCILYLLPSLEALHEAGLVYCDLKPDNIMLMDGGVKLIDLGAVRGIGETAEDIYGSPGYMPDLDGPDKAIPSVAMDIYSAGRTLAALLLDFDNTGEHLHGLPSSRVVNRMFGVDEIARLTGAVEGEVRFSLAGGERLPAWMSVSRFTDRKGEAIYVLHGSAPDGFARLDVEVCVEGSLPGLITLSCPLALESLKALLERASHPDPEGRFAGTSDMSMHCAGVLREILGAEGLPPQGASMSFAQQDGDISVAMPLGAEWTMLAPPLLNKEDDGFEAVVRALDERSDEVRINALADAVRSSEGWAGGIDAHLRYVETVLACGDCIGEPDKSGNVHHFLRLAVQARPWDWRPAWMEAKYWMRVGKYAEAVSCLSYVAHILPGESMPKVALGMALEAIGNSAAALALHESAWRASPRLAPARLMRLRSMFMLADGGFDGAHRDFIRVFPSAQEALVNFMRQGVLCASDVDFEWRATRLMSFSGGEDASMLRGIVSRMRQLGIASLGSGLDALSLSRVADVLDPPPVPVPNRLPGFSGVLGKTGIGKTMAGIMGTGWRRSA